MAPTATASCHCTELGLSPTCSTQEIRKACLKLAKKHHPDKQSTEEAKKKSNVVFLRIKEAYHALHDVETRKRCDLIRGTKSAGAGSYCAEEEHEKDRQKRQEEQARRDEERRQQEQDRQKRQAEQRRYEAWRRQQQNENLERETERKRRQEEAQRRQRAAEKSRQEQEAWQKQQQQAWQKQQQQAWQKQQQQAWQKQQQQAAAQQRAKEEAQRAERLRRERIRREQELERQRRAADWTSNDTTRPKITTHGLAKTGEACKRCLNQGTYCYQHKDQAPFVCRTACPPPRAVPVGCRRTACPRTATYGLTKTGAACKRCINQGTYCYQHKDQAYR